MELFLQMSLVLSLVSSLLENYRKGKLENHRNWPPPEVQPLHLNLKISKVNLRLASGSALTNFSDLPGALPRPQSLGLDAA